jgi:hypothetical protein
MLAAMHLFLIGCAMPVSQADVAAMEYSFDTSIIKGKTTWSEVLAMYGYLSVPQARGVQTSIFTMLLAGPRPIV